MWVQMKIQAREIENTKKQIQSVSYIQDLVYNIESTDVAILEHKQMIDMLRENKVIDCKELWENMPVSLIETCWMPESQ